MGDFSFELGLDRNGLFLLWSGLRLGLEVGEGNGGTEVKGGLELFFNLLSLFDKHLVVLLIVFSAKVAFYRIFLLYIIRVEQVGVEMSLSGSLGFLRGRPRLLVALGRMISPGA